MNDNDQQKQLKMAGGAGRHGDRRLPRLVDGHDERLHDRIRRRPLDRPHDSQGHEARATATRWASASSALTVSGAPRSHPWGMNAPR